MNIFDLDNLSLFIYAILKAFLPLPSLEVMLVPMVIIKPNNVLLYSLIGAVGTFIGATIGYYIAYFGRDKFISKFASSESLKRSELFIGKYGVLSVFIGGITPIPDFILAYGAGFAKMNYFTFVFSDAIARFLRSLIVGYAVASFDVVIDMDKWGSVLSIFIIGFFIIRWLLSKKEKD